VDIRWPFLLCELRPRCGNRVIAGYTRPTLSGRCGRGTNRWLWPRRLAILKPVVHVLPDHALRSPISDQEIGANAIHGFECQVPRQR
jgi:hypothetical protein